MDKKEDTDLPTEDIYSNIHSKIKALLELNEHSPLQALTEADRIQLNHLKDKMVALLERAKQLELDMEEMSEGTSDDTDIEDDSEELEVLKDCEEIEDSEELEVLKDCEEIEDL